MEAPPSNPSWALEHLSNCDCSYCINSPPVPQLNAQNDNWYARVVNNSNQHSATNMARKDYAENNSHDKDGYETGSDSDGNRTKDQDAIRDAPYLPQIQVWARPEGPYTLKIGHQWFHCDDLIINGSEYNRQQQQRSNGNAAVYPPKRPMAARSQSYNRERKPQTTANTRSGNFSPPKTVASGYGYQSQVVPTLKEQGRRQHRRHHDETGDSQNPRSRRDSGVSVGDTENSKHSSISNDTSYNNALVRYDYKPPSALRTDPSGHALAQNQSPKAASGKPARPGMGRRGSSRAGSYQIPVRSKGRKAVRFAALPS